MGLKYETLIKKDKISESYRNILFKENKLFCYYILKFIYCKTVMSLAWCDINNNNMRFDTSEIYLINFICL